jgi:hypothetical protein
MNFNEVTRNRVEQVGTKSPLHGTSAPDVVSRVKFGVDGSARENQQNTRNGVFTPESPLRIRNGVS